MPYPATINAPKSGKAEPPHLFHSAVQIMRPSIAAMRNQKSCRFCVLVAEDKIGSRPKGAEFFRERAEWGLIAQKNHSVGFLAGGDYV